MQGRKHNGQGEDSGTRQAILAAARTLFAELGFDGTSTQAIVELSQTSKGSFYHLFASKEDLYAAVLEGMMEQIWDASFATLSDEMIDSDSFWMYIARAWQRSVGYMLEHPDEMRLWRGFQETWRAIGDAGPARRLRAKNLQMGERLAALGQQLGCVRCDLSPAQCAELVEATDMVTDGWFFVIADKHGGREAFRRQAPLSLELIWRILAPIEQLSAGEGFPAARYLSADLAAPASEERY
ncbi:MAG: TetR/AcrR family transcriptional regulator [Proteobacteria bacterium]|nr:TetR/AcrR family transcriptional regulator [Pseudomonadota bacterium]